MAQSDLVMRARRGETGALAQLIGTSLASRGISVRVEWQGDHLYVLLEGQTLPSAQALIPNLRQGFERLAIHRAIASIHLYARHPGQKNAVWAETFSLKPILDRPPSPPREKAAGRGMPAAAAIEANAAAKAKTEAKTETETETGTGTKAACPSPASPLPERGEPPLGPDPCPPIKPDPVVPAEPEAGGPVSPAPPPRPPASLPETSPPPPSAPYLSDTALLTLAQVAPLLGYLVWLSNTWIGLPFFWTGSFLLPWRILGPLALLLVKGNDADLIKTQAREALNFQLSLTLYWLVTFVLMFLLVGFLLVLPLAFFEVVCVVRAAVKASEGQPMRYPLTIRFIR